MPRSSASAPPRYRLHRARNLAVVTIDGKDVYLGRYGTPESREKYSQLIADWKPPVAARATEARPLKATLTIGELTLRYAKFAESYYVKAGQPTAQVQRIRSALRELNRMYATDPAEGFGPIKLKALQSALINRVDLRVRKTNRRTLSRKYINALVSCIVRAFKWAVSEELVSPSVYSSLRTVEGLKAGRTAARESAGVSPVDANIVDRTLQVVPPNLAAMIRLQMLTGMRPEDVVSMRPCEITRPSTGPWTYQPESHKCAHLGRQRVVFFGPQAREVLQDWLQDITPASRIFSLHRREPTVAAGPKFDKDTYRQSIQRFCRRHGIPLWSPNQLRHLYGTHVRQRFGLEGAQVVLGHSRADTTQIYAERDLGLAARVQETMG